MDNDGSVQIIWDKGWTTVCDLCNTVVRAMHQISTALDCELFVHSIERCSNKGAEAASRGFIDVPFRNNIV